MTGKSFHAKLTCHPFFVSWTCKGPFFFLITPLNRASNLRHSKYKIICVYETNIRCNINFVTLDLKNTLMLQSNNEKCFCKKIAMSSLRIVVGNWSEIKMGFFLLVKKRLFSKQQCATNVDDHVLVKR